MIKHLLVIALVSLIMGATQVVSAESTAPSEKVYNEVSQSVYTIFSINEENKEKNALGSAVAVTGHLLATNCHVAFSGRFLIVEINNKPVLGTLAYYNQEKDMCIVEVTDATLKPVNIRPSKSVRIGEQVYAIGNPEGFERTISQGIISNKEFDNDNISKLQTDAAISHGSSGGGLFDKDSNLIGITTSSRADAENIGFAIPTELILEVIDSKKTTSTTSNETNQQDEVSNKTTPSTPATDEPNNSISRIGYYGKSEIGLMKWQGRCFISIVGRYQATNPISVAIWFPDKPNKLLIFSRVVTAENAIKFIKWTNEEKDIQYTQSKSFLFFDKNLYPLTIISVNKQNQPVYIFSKKNNLTEDFVTLDYFLGQFYGYGQNEGMTTIKFSLDGFTEALADYNKYCK